MAKIGDSVKFRQCLSAINQHTNRQPADGKPYARDHKYTLPFANTKTPIPQNYHPHLGGKTWQFLHHTGQQGQRGFKKGDGLAAIKRRYGMTTGWKVHEDVVMKIVDAWIKTGTLPDPVISPTPMAPSFRASNQTVNPEPQGPRH